MIHLATDSHELLAALREREGLKRSRTIAPVEVFEQDDVRAYVLDHGGPRAVARFAYLVGRDDAIDATAVIFAFAGSVRQEPALIHTVRRGSASYRPDLLVNPGLETVSVRVLPDDTATVTAEEAVEPTVSLLLWWLLGAAETFFEPQQIIPLLVPQMRGKAAEAALDAVARLIAGARELRAPSGTAE